MLTSSFRESSRRSAEGAAGICIALALSYLEHLLPLQAVVPIPGFKLGLANIVVIFLFYRSSPLDAFAVSVMRVILSSLLFGGFSTLLYSLFGAVMAFLSLILNCLIFKNKLSFIGVSISSAIFHNLGQIMVASAFYSVGAVIYLTPQLLICALICGAFTGIILSSLPRSIFLKKEHKE